MRGYWSAKPDGNPASGVKSLRRHFGQIYDASSAGNIQRGHDVAHAVGGVVNKGEDYDRTGQSERQKGRPTVHFRRSRLDPLRRLWQETRDRTTAVGTFYDRSAGINAVFDGSNSGTAYGHKVGDNT